MQMTTPVLAKYWACLLCLLLPQFITAQSADSVYHERLFYLCKAWGHVKYFHPEVANGNVDWDDALLNVVPQVKAAEDNDAFNAVVLEWLAAVGDPGNFPNSKPQVPDSLNNNADLSWMETPVFSTEVQANLQNLWDNARPRDHVLLRPQFNGGPADFTIDNQYHQGDVFPDEPQRVLAAFRFWNIIHYFFPYKYIMDQDWDTSLRMHLPDIVTAADALAYNQALARLTVEVDDTHAFYSSATFWEWKGSNYPPFLARFAEDELVITKVLPGVTEVAVGDVIKEIDSQTVDHWVTHYLPYAYASNEVVQQRTLMESILFGPEGPFTLTVSDGTEERSVELTRNGGNSTALRASTTPVYTLEEQNGCRVGKIDMGQLETEEIPEMFNTFRRTDALVFDIRNYPNGTLWTLVDYLFQDRIHIANFTTPDLRFPGHFYWNEVSIGQGTSQPYEGQVVILFDETTQSQAEYTVMGLEQFPGSVKVGSITSAADGNVSGIRLP
ncbi:MAG TPA: hypothetical protein DCR93_04615, partial [Cytophagales bacterium]|nr:hypothetical protein [Cytophagales bacterium]